MVQGEVGSGAHLASTGWDSWQDEQGAYTLLSTQLSSLLGEHPVTHPEVQGNESDLFMDCFPCGLTCQGWGSPGVLRWLPTPQMGTQCHHGALCTLSTLLPPC